MTDTQSIDLTKAILKRVANNDTIQFSLITNYGTYKATKLYLAASKKLLKSFKKAKDKAFAEYFATMHTGHKQSLRAFKEFMLYRSCYEFFRTEVATTKDMIKEYKTFLWYNDNFIKQWLLGYQREERDMVDFRTLPWRLF